MTPEIEKKTLLGAGYQSIDNEETGLKTGATNDGHSNDDVGDDKSKTLKEELDEKRLYSFFDASNCPGSRATKGFGLLLVPFFIAGGLFITRTSISEAPAVSISTLSFGPGVMEVTSSNGIMHTRSRSCTFNHDCSPEEPYCNNNFECVRNKKKCVDYDCSEHYWSSCSYDPSCPAGYEFDRSENGPCWFSTRRIVCKRTLVCTRC